MSLAPTPPRLRAAKGATTAAAALTLTTALAVGAAAPSVYQRSAKDEAVAMATLRAAQRDVDLAASIGLYPIGPGAQIARLLGAGTPQDALSTLGIIAGLIPGDTGTNLQALLDQVADLVQAAQTGITLLPPNTLPDTPQITIPIGSQTISIPPAPLAVLTLIFGSTKGVNIPPLALSQGLKLALPEIAVPALGPAGTYDQVAGLEGDLSTQLILSLVKTLQANADNLNIPTIDPTLASALGIDPALLSLLDTLPAIANLIGDIPLNVPGQESDVFFKVFSPVNPLNGNPIFPNNPVLDLSLELFVSTATKLAILPSFGLGGTNIAITAPFFLNDPEFKDTVVLAIPIRNTSRPGGGVVALLNPLSSLVGINLSNIDGREGNGNVTFWDITAAYDLLSDAPSTIYNPIAWANSVVGALAPTYLIPDNAEVLAGVIEQIAGGNVDLNTILQALTALNPANLFHVEGAGPVPSADGNMYITYDSGHLPLLEPFQFLPRTLSYLPGFDISTPVSESFNDVLTQLVAMGYQDVNLTTTGGVPVFSRGWDMAGTQAEFWKSPISFEDGLQVPQALFNALIGNGTTTGLTGNLLNPADQQLELFGNSEIGDLVYRNAVSIALAQVVRDGLLQVKNALNPVFDAVDSNGLVVGVAKALDDAVDQVNGVIAQGGTAIKGLDIDLATPLMQGNREFNKVTAAVSDGIHNLFSGTNNVQTLNVAPQNKLAPTAAAPTLADEGGSAENPFKQAAEELGLGKIVINRNNDLATGATKATTDLQDAVDKRVTKTQKSLNKRAAEAKEVGNELAKGNLKEAAKKAADNAKKRADRLKKDIKNGADKLQDAGEKLAKPAKDDAA